MVSSTRILRVAEQLALDTSGHHHDEDTKQLMVSVEGLVEEVGNVFRNSLDQHHFESLFCSLSEHAKYGHLSVERFKGLFVDWISGLIMEKTSVNSSFWDVFNKYSISAGSANSSMSSKLNCTLPFTPQQYSKIKSDCEQNQFDRNSTTICYDNDVEDTNHDNQLNNESYDNSMRNESLEFTHLADQNTLSQQHHQLFQNSQPADAVTISSQASGSRNSLSNNYRASEIINSEQYKSEIIYLKQRLTSRESVISSQAEQLKQFVVLQEKYDELRCKIKESEKQLRAFRNESVSNKRQILEYESKLQSTNNELVKFVNKCDDLNSNIRNILNDKQQVGIDNSKLKSEIESLKSERNILVQKADQLVKDNTSLQQQCNASASLVNSMTMSSSRNTEEICSAFERSMLYSKLNTDSIQIHSANADQLKLYKEKLNRIQSIAYELNDMNVELVETIKDLHSQMEMLKALIDKLTHDHQCLLESTVKNFISSLIVKTCDNFNDHSPQNSHDVTTNISMHQNSPRKNARLLAFVLLIPLAILIKLVDNYFKTGALLGYLDEDLVEYLGLTLFN